MPRGSKDELEVATPEVATPKVATPKASTPAHRAGANVLAKGKDRKCGLCEETIVAGKDYTYRKCKNQHYDCGLVRKSIQRFGPKACCFIFLFTYLFYGALIIFAIAIVYYYIGSFLFACLRLL